VLRQGFLVKLGKTRWWAKARACNRIFTDDEKSLLPVVIIALEIIIRDFNLPARSRSKAVGDLKKWLSFDTLAVGVLFNSIFTFTGPVSDYLQTQQLDHVQAARLTTQLIPDISSINMDDILAKDKQLAEHTNAKLAEVNLMEEFTSQFGEIDSKVELESSAQTKRVSTVPQRLGELNGK